MEPPAGVGQSAAQWIQVAAPGGRKLLAAVYRPEGSGPFPIVMVIHGTEGFNGQRYLRLAEDLAQGGFLVVVGCWFQGSYGPMPSSSVPCPEGPEFAGANLDTMGNAIALIGAASTLRDGRADRIGLFGHSRGGEAALLIGSTLGGVQAIVVSAGTGTGATSRRVGSPSGPILVSDTPPITLVDSLEPPVLLLHGTDDPLVPVENTYAYETALRSLAKPVEAHYYEGAGHPLPFLPLTAADVRQRAIGFLQQHLAE